MKISKLGVLIIDTLGSSLRFLLIIIIFITFTSCSDNSSPIQSEEVEYCSDIDDMLLGIGSVRILSLLPYPAYYDDEGFRTERMRIKQYKKGNDSIIFNCFFTVGPENKQHLLSEFDYRTEIDSNDKDCVIYNFDIGRSDIIPDKISGKILLYEVYNKHEATLLQTVSYGVPNITEWIYFDNE